MCRSIKTLRRPTEPPTEAEILAAARQYVRKISGYRVPSRANEPAFEHAVAEVARATEALLATLVTKPPATSQLAHPPVPLESPH